MGHTSARKIDEVALGRVLDNIDTVMPSSGGVRTIIERYHHEVWISALHKNSSVMALVRLRPGGDGIPWSRAQERANGRYYLQTVDFTRARAVLDDPDARWQVFHSRQRLSAGAEHDVMVRRLPNKVPL